MRKKSESNSLKKILTQSTLLGMAGDRYFARGEDYFRQGYVHNLAVDGNSVTAYVQGTEAYSVELWVETGELQASCTCPLGMDELFCKHCVAVGLTWLANPGAAKSQKSRSGQKPVTMEEVQQFLGQQEKSTLIQWMLDRAKQDESWKQLLILKVASTRPQGIDITTFQRALQNAIVIRGYIEWNQIHAYADKIQGVFASIETLLKAHPQTVVELCEYALPLLETAMDSIDDSNGYVGEIMEDFQALHYDACELAQPDPIALAERLLEAELNSGFGTFSSAVETYAPILGKPGLARYRQLAEAMWAEFPALSPKDAGQRSFNYKRSKLQRILEALAKVDGGLEAIVAIKRQDLSDSHTYLQIAQLYLQDGQRDRALEWAEEGLKAFEHPSSRLQDLVIEEYYLRGRVEEAMALVWQGFIQAITLRSYQQLKAHAERVNQWDSWRDRAINYIRQQFEPPAAPQPDRNSRISRKPAQVRQVAWKPPRLFGIGRSILVEIFLWEGEDELAWQEAQTGGCSKSLWFQLAERRQQDHPADALPIYYNEIEPLIQQTNNAAYTDAVSLLKKVHDLMVRLKQQHEFNDFVDYLRQTYKAKRNFIALLNKQQTRK
jgi:uncharacterized Zn finger protein